MVTTKDIAKICNVSRTTVSRAFNDSGRINDETKQLILNTAKELGYRPDILATSLKNGRTRSIGVVVFDAKNPYFAQMLNAIETEARKRDYFVNITLHQKNAGLEHELLQKLVDYRVEGIILSPVSKGKEFEKFLSGLGKPVVLLGNRVSGNLPYVGIDEKKAAKEAVESICARGYKRIVFVCPPLSENSKDNNYTHEKRKQGYSSAVLENGLLEEIISSDDYAKEAKDMVNNSKDKIAFFCSGDGYALDIMKELRLAGKKAEKDYGIMGFDNIQFLDYVVPRLSTIDNSVEMVAEKAVDLLFDLMNGEKVPNKTYVEYKVINGDTI
jgi:LacI family transcriptional regulator